MRWPSAHARRMIELGAAGIADPAELRALARTAKPRAWRRAERLRVRIQRFAAHAQIKFPPFAGAV